MNNKRRFKLKKGIIQKLFWIISIIFILFVLLMFLYRMIINIKKYNNNLKIYEYTIKNNEMTKDDDEYIFKGKEENNYIKYGNLMFRIVKIYKDGSMDIVTDSSINSMMYDSTDYSFSESSIREYLNNVFLSNIDVEYLNKSPYCDEFVEDISSFSCKDINFSSYVKLLSASEYLDSYLDGISYISNDAMWLSSSSKDFVWVGNNGNLSKGKVTDIYSVYPVITLNNRVEYVSGDGTQNNPFVINKNKHEIGSYVKISEDMYRIISKDGSKLKLMLVDNNYLVRRSYGDDLLDYLNTDFYDKLSYKKILEKYKISISSYNGEYDSIDKKTKTVYIGIPSVKDLKIDNSVSEYFLINKSVNDKFYYYDSAMKEDNELSMKLRLVISIKESKLGTGDGTQDNPYVVGV